MKFIDLKNKRFGRLICLSDLRKIHGKIMRVFWKCVCDCGKITNVRSCFLISGKTQSCGCFLIERIKEANTTHGDSKDGKITSIYRTWSNMIQRCYNKNNCHYNRYGGRGIYVCYRWKNSFSSFKRWALYNGYSEILQIDRINNNDGYYPSNCRWVTCEENQNNKSNNHIVEFPDGKMTIMQASRFYKIGESTIRQRLKKLTPIQCINHKKYERWICAN